MAGFWKPGAGRPEFPASLQNGNSVDVDRDGDYEAGLTGSLGLQKQREKLPICQRRMALLYLVENHATTIVVGETGSGKSTQIPQFLVEAGWASGGRLIGCTQPRRVAVQTVSARVAEEMKVSLGAEVGYSIRFENITTPGVTRVKYLTDGVLLREMMEDPLLSRYSVIMVDEAHERSIATDILLGLLKKIQRKRLDLRLIVASATLAAEEMANFFDTSTERLKSTENSKSLPNRKPGILSVEGRVHPVQLNFLEDPCSDYLQKAIDTVLAIHNKEEGGDILVFLTGQEEVDTGVQLLTDAENSGDKKTKNLYPLPLYAGLSRADQDLVFAPVPRGKRKVILATNIAETSLTLEGVVYVVDSGFSKQKYYNPITDIESLIVAPISRASARQRAGRAGRVRPGKCYRLYTEKSFLEDMEGASVPEIQRSNLSTVVLQLKSLGIDSMMRFEWLSPPPPEAMVRALELLYVLGVVGEDSRLTKPRGVQAAEIPLEPMLACLLLEGGERGCGEEAITIASCLCVQSVWVGSRGRRELDEAKAQFAAAQGDFITYLNLYEGFLRSNKSGKWCHNNFVNYRAMMRVCDVRLQLGKLLLRLGKKIKSCERDVLQIQKALVAVFFMNVAQLQIRGAEAVYKNLRSDTLMQIHPSSVLFRSTPKWVMYHSVTVTERSYMREVSVIDPLWLTEVAGHAYQRRKFAR